MGGASGARTDHKKCFCGACALGEAAAAHVRAAIRSKRDMDSRVPRGFRRLGSSLVSFLTQLAGAVIMAPMTKGSNLPYRRLGVELGATITVIEMTLARRLKQQKTQEFALIRRFAGEPCFGVQLATVKPDEAAWAAALVASRGV